MLTYADELMKSTGYNELSLASLSTGDYTCLHELVEGLRPITDKYDATLALPSLRLDSFTEEVSEMKRGSLTFAPEAGTQRLRDVINKNITEEDIVNTLTIAAKQGYKSIKLYFMIGLPTETDEDIEGIADIVRLAKRVFYENGDKNKNVRISLSTAVFVPKPLTPFEWERQISFEEMEHKQTHLREALDGIKNVRYNWHDASISRLEAAFARGDRALSRVLEIAYAKGCHFDSWTEHFDYESWLASFDEAGLAIDDYTRSREVDEVLPWDFIDNGVRREYLSRERDRAYRGETTAGCNKGCQGCGASKLGRCFE